MFSLRRQISPIPVICIALIIAALTLFNVKLQQHAPRDPISQELRKNMANSSTLYSKLFKEAGVSDMRYAPLIRDNAETYRQNMLYELLPKQSTAALLMYYEQAKIRWQKGQTEALDDIGFAQHALFDKGVPLPKADKTHQKLLNILDVQNRTNIPQ